MEQEPNETLDCFLDLLLNDIDDAIKQMVFLTDKQKVIKDMLFMYLCVINVTVLNRKNTYFSVTQNIPYYLTKSVETVTSLIERFLELLEVDASLQVNFPTENAGWLGFGRAIVSLPSIRTTVDMVGLSPASC